MAKIRTTYGIEVISGKVGGAVFSNEADGVGMRDYNPTSNQPFSTSQVQIETNFTKATRAWLTLTPSQVSQWRDFAKTQKVRNPLTGKYRIRKGREVFVGLYAKLLQVNPASSKPFVPAGAFAGDSIGITCAASTGKLTFTASAANATDVTTEMLIQRLPSANSLTNPDGFHTAAFKKFAVGALTQDVTVSPGSYIAAYRFVSTTTGQVAGYAILPVMTVTLSLEDGGADEAPAAKRKAA